MSNPRSCDVKGRKNAPVSFEEPDALETTGSQPTSNSPAEDLASTWLLLDGARRHDPKALDAIVDRYSSVLFRAATGKLSGRARGMLETRDLVQDVFTKFFLSLEKIKCDRKGSVRKFLLTTMKNHLIDVEEAAGRRMEEQASPILDELPASGMTITAQLVRDEEYTTMRRALDVLSDSERTAVIYRIFDTKPQDIARALGRPPGNTTQRFIQRAVHKWKAEYKRLKAAEE